MQARALLSQLKPQRGYNFLCIFSHHIQKVCVVEDFAISGLLYDQMAHIRNLGVPGHRLSLQPLLQATCWHKFQISTGSYHRFGKQDLFSNHPLFLLFLLLLLLLIILILILLLFLHHLHLFSVWRLPPAVSPLLQLAVFLRAVLT